MDPRAFAVLFHAPTQTVLVTVRSLSINNGGKIGLPGGHTDGEHPLIAVKRELQEEVGISIPEEVIADAQASFDKKGDECHLFAFRCTHQISTENNDPAEVSLAAWVPLPALFNMQESDRHYSLKAFLHSSLVPYIRTFP